MRALALHGVMPGDRPPVPRVVRLSTSSRFTPAPLKNTYRPSSLAQSSARKLSGTFDLDELPLSLALGAGGLGVMYLSWVLPSPIRQIAFVAGIGSVSFGILNLFSGEPEWRSIEVAPPEVPTSEQIPEAPPGWLASDVNLVFPVDQPNVGGRVRQQWGDQEYEFSVRNNTTRKVSFYAGLAIFSAAGDTLGGLLWKTPSAQRQLYSVAPEKAIVTGEKDGPSNLFAPAMVPEHMGAFADGRTLVEVQLFRNRGDREPALISEAIPIYQAMIG